MIAVTKLCRFVRFTLRLLPLPTYSRVLILHCQRNLSPHVFVRLTTPGLMIRQAAYFKQDWGVTTTTNTTTALLCTYVTTVHPPRSSDHPPRTHTKSSAFL